MEKAEEEGKNKAKGTASWKTQRRHGSDTGLHARRRKPRENNKNKVLYCESARRTKKNRKKEAGNDRGAGECRRHSGAKNTHRVIGQEQKALNSQEHLETESKPQGLETNTKRSAGQGRAGRVTTDTEEVWSSESARGRRKAWRAAGSFSGTHSLSLSLCPSLEERTRRGSSGG